jgi:hypothetical protein
MRLPSSPRTQQLLWREIPALLFGLQNLLRLDIADTKFNARDLVRLQSFIFCAVH